MKKLKFLILTILTCLLGLFAVACSQTIDFDYNIDFVVDGEVIATVGTNGDEIAMPKNPTKENYTFDGWYWDEGKWDDEFTLNSILDQPLQDKNHYRVYAKFKSSVYYTVIFDNGDEEITQQIKYGERTALRLNTFPLPGDNYIFTGWSNYSDCKFMDGEEVFNICAVGETIRLYPQWEYDYGCYTVVFDANGGKGTMANQTIGTMDNVALSANAFTREYCDFLGWSYNQEGDYADFQDEQTVSYLASKGQTVTLYARWKTSENVYLLYEPADLVTVKENPNGIYVLQNDLNCVSLSLQPFATGNAPFNGTFDGNGFSITGISIVGHDEEPRRASLFGYIGENGYVKDLGISFANTVSRVSEAAIFAIKNVGLIENCYALNSMVEVDTDGNENWAVRSAGLVLENHGTVKNCCFQGNIISTVPVGEHGASAGICLVNTGTVENCLVIQTAILVVNDRNTYGEVNVLVGENRGRVKNCFYDADSIFEVIRYTYKQDDNVLTRFFLTSNLGGSVSTAQLNSSSFYTDTLRWSRDVWYFSDLDVENQKYPILKQQ